MENTHFILDETCILPIHKFASVLTLNTVHRVRQGQIRHSIMMGKWSLSIKNTIYGLFWSNSPCIWNEGLSMFWWHPALVYVFIRFRQDNVDAESVSRNSHELDEDQNSKVQSRQDEHSLDGLWPQRQCPPFSEKILVKGSIGLQFWGDETFSIVAGGLSGFSGSEHLPQLVCHLLPLLSSQ